MSVPIIYPTQYYQPPICWPPGAPTCGPPPRPPRRRPRYRPIPLPGVCRTPMECRRAEPQPPPHRVTPLPGIIPGHILSVMPLLPPVPLLHSLSLIPLLLIRVL